MRLSTFRIAVLSTVIAPLMWTAGTASAATQTIHPGGFDPSLSDTRSSGHLAFLEDGLSIYTDDSSSQAKVAEYIDVPSQNLPDAVSLSWSGSDPQPGSQIVFDFDQTPGNGNDFNILVGEPIYGNDFWLTNGSSADAHGVCPETGGGFGSACHGTLSQWKGAIPNADVKAYGFSLGSGVHGAGVLHNIVADSTEFRFSDTTNPPPTPTTVDVTGHVTITKKVGPHAKSLISHLSTDALGPNQIEGHKAHWKVFSDNHRIYKSVMGAGDATKVRARFPFHTGRHTVTVVLNGDTVKTATVRTGRHGGF